MLKIGELARRSGLTVRTLHHYDAIGLLSPSGRSGSGYRLYSEADVVRLHGILTLRQTGCSLAAVRELLDGSGSSPLAAVNRQIDGLEEQIGRARTLLARLRLLRDRMESGEAGDPGEWLAVLEMTALYEKHFSPDELAAVRILVETSGGSPRREWKALIAKAREAMESGLPPESGEALELSREWMRLIGRMTGGDAGLAGKLKAMVEGEARARELSGITPDMIRWLSQARERARTEAATGGQGHEDVIVPGPDARDQTGAGTSTAAAPKPTALRMAQLRAAHQLLDDPLVFPDPLAPRILGPDGESSLRNNLDTFNSPLHRGLRTSAVVRARLASDAWEGAQTRGVRQLLILGAGLDTTALRAPDNTETLVFEVDLTATQQWKRSLLREAGLPEPPSLHFVPVDFERATLAEALSRAGFHADEPAFVSWLGVTMYLEEEAILGTLRFVASLPPGSGVVFDYAVRPELLSPRERKGLDLILARTAENGEPWKTFLDPALVAAKLGDLGFTRVEDLGPDALNDRYLSGRTDGLRKSGVTRLVNARV